MHSSFQPSVFTELPQLQPMGDYLLVKPTERPLSKLWLPESVKKGMQKLRHGIAVAVGPGDKILTLKCEACGRERDRLALLGFAHAEHLRLPIHTGRCKCGDSRVEVVSDAGRAPMSVQVGDEVLYWRSPANDVRINGEEYVFLHEEQHLVAVLERETDDVQDVVA